MDNIVALFSSDGSIISEFSDVISYDHDFVEFKNNGYRSKIYCNTENGEYFDVVLNND